MLLRPVVRALALVALCAPLAIALTLVAWPLWGWFEARTGIEALGHSGPASWCYLFVYAALLGLSGALAYLAARRRRR